MKEQIEKFMQDMQGSEPRKGGKVLHKDGGPWMIFDKFEGNLAWCYCPTQGYINIDREEIGEFKNTILIGDVLERVNLKGRLWRAEGCSYKEYPWYAMMTAWGVFGLSTPFQEIFNQCEWEDAGVKCDHVVCNDAGYRGGCQLQVPKQDAETELFEFTLILDV